MGEKEVVIDQLRLTYEGIFSIKELYKLMTEYLEEKGYDQKELKNIERVTPEGKFIEIWFLPWKKVTDYAKNEIRIRLLCMDLKKVEVEKDDAKVQLDQGTLQIVFDGYVTWDYENRWEEKPTFFLIRTLFDKYFYSPFSNAIRKGLRKDVDDMRGRILSFLNIYKAAG